MPRQATRSKIRGIGLTPELKLGKPGKENANLMKNVLTRHIKIFRILCISVQLPFRANVKLAERQGGRISSAIQTPHQTLAHNAKLFLSPQHLNSVPAPKLLNPGNQSVLKVPDRLPRVFNLLGKDRNVDSLRTG